MKQVTLGTQYELYHGPMGTRDAMPPFVAGVMVECAERLLHSHAVVQDVLHYDLDAIQLHEAAHRKFVETVPLLVLAEGGSCLHTAHLGPLAECFAAQSSVWAATQGMRHDFTYNPRPRSCSLITATHSEADEH